MGTVFLLCLAGLDILPLPLAGSASLKVEEVDGLLFVKERVNTFHITRHIQLWAADLQGDMDRLDMLMAAKSCGTCLS